MLREFWRDGERLVPLFERAVAAQKTWESLQLIVPFGMEDASFQAELRLVYSERELERAGRLRVTGHSEREGELLVRLWLGERLLRRGHIGSGHEEPGSGMFIPGPHIHYPTTAFLNIDSRRSRSRVYSWEISQSASLQEVMVSFARHVNVIGDVPEIQQ